MDTRIDRYLDGELDSAAADELLWDVERNPEVRRELERARMLRESFWSLPRYASPADMRRQVAMRIRQSAGDRSARPSRRMQAGLTLAGACVVLLLALVLIPTTRDSEPAPTTSEVQQALHDVKFAFALVADAGLRTGEAIRSELLEIPNDHHTGTATPDTEPSRQKTTP